MGDIGQQEGADRISDFAILAPVGGVGITAEAADDQARLVLQRQPHHLLVVEFFSVGIDAVADDMVVDAAAVDRAAVGQMAAHDQVHTHDGVADIKQGGIDGIISRCARKRLHVDVEVVSAEALGLEDFGRSAARERLKDVGVFRALVIALIGIAAEFGQAAAVVENLRLRHAARIR